MLGKEFILQRSETRVGSDYHCDIVLVKDPTVAPVHALFKRALDSSVALFPQGGAVTVNGQPTAGGLIRSGDSIGIGSTILSYEQRVAIGQ